MSEKGGKADGQNEAKGRIFSELRSIWALKTAQLPPPQITSQLQATSEIKEVRGASDGQLTFRVSRLVTNGSPAFT